MLVVLEELVVLEMLSMIAVLSVNVLSMESKKLEYELSESSFEDVGSGSGS